MILRIKKNLIGNKKDLNIQYRRHKYAKKRAARKFLRGIRRGVKRKVKIKLIKSLFDKLSLKQRREVFKYVKLRRYRKAMRQFLKKQRRLFKKFRTFRRRRQKKYRRYRKTAQQKKSKKLRKSLYRAFKVPKKDHPRMARYTQRLNTLLDFYKNRAKFMLSSMLLKRGLRQKSNNFVLHLIKSYKKDNRGRNVDFMFRKSFKKLEIYIRFLTKRVGSQKHKIPIYLSAKQGFAMGVRELANSSRKLSKGTNILKNLVSEVLKSRNKMSNAFIKRKLAHMQALDNRIYLKYLRKR